MISAEVRVNGRLIGHLYAHNEGSATDSWEARAADVCRYFYEYIEIGTGKPRKTGYVQHARSDGAAALMAKLFAEVTA